MSFLNPLAFTFGLLAVPILLLYMLKLRRREQRVSSTLLWRMVLRDRQANSPWQRLQRSLLLILQLLILAALVLALARPTLEVPGISAPAVVLILDASASMRAEDVQPSRFEAGKQAARRILDDLSSTTQVTLILAGPQPEVLVSSERDHGVIQHSLEEAQPSQGEADWEAAVRLAAGAMQNSQNPSLVVLSDGGLPESGLPPIPGEVHYLPVGFGRDNLAIKSLALRAAAQGVELFASVKNFGVQDHRAVLSFYRDGQLFEAQEINLPAGEQVPVVLEDLDDRPATYMAQLLPATGEFFVDPLELDNSAFAVYQTPATADVLLVSPGNLFLEQILASLPEINAYRAIASENGSSSATGEFDTIVYDGIIPEELPDTNLLLVNPPANDLFTVTRIFTDTAPAAVSPGPLTEFLDWSSVHIRSASQVMLPDWSEALVSAPGGPLVFIGETGGRRVAVITFDLHDSDLPLQVAYPVLMDSLLNYLNRLSDGLAVENTTNLRPGDRVRLAPANGSWLVTTPSGDVIPLETDENGAIFTQTTETGIYQVELEGDQPDLGRAFAVNLFSDTESDLSVRTELKIGEAVVPAGIQEEIGRRDLWPWLALFALLFLVFEWWVYFRPQSISAPV